MFLFLLLTEDTFYFVLLNTLECSKIAEAHTVTALAASQLSRGSGRKPSSTSISTPRLVWRLRPESRDPPCSLSLRSCLNSLPHPPVSATWGLLPAACHFSSTSVLSTCNLVNCLELAIHRHLSLKSSSIPPSPVLCFAHSWWWSLPARLGHCPRPGVSLVPAAGPASAPAPSDWSVPLRLSPHCT